MDANGTRFQLLLGEENWANCIDYTNRWLEENSGQAWNGFSLDWGTTPLQWNRDRNDLTLQPRLFQFGSSPADNPPSLESRRGGGRDRYGNWYWISENRDEIRVNSVGTGLTSHFWSAIDGAAYLPTARPGEFRPQATPELPATLQLSGLAVTEDHYLLAGVLDPAGLLLFDLYSGGLPRHLLWPRQVDFVPFDMAPAPGGGVWILDRKHARYWGLDCHFNVIAQGQQMTTLVPEQVDLFQPRDGSATRQTVGQTFPQGISLRAASSLTNLDPIAIEALPDGTVLILDNNATPESPFSNIFRYRFGKQLGIPVSTQTMQSFIEKQQDTGKQTDFRLIGYDFAFVPEHTDTDGTVIHDCLFVVGADGNQSYAFDLSQQDEQLLMSPLPDYFPMRLFAGKGLVAAGTGVYYDFADSWIPLVAQPRRRYSPEALLLTSPGPQPFVLDGHTPDCTWHRLMLDACIPPGTAVQVWSRAANDPQALALTQWHPEPRLYLRGDGSEFSFTRKVVGEGNGTWELLFQNARGRYLQLGLWLVGNGRSTPRVRALRAYYPRFSYLAHYLPAVYREDRQSASFLDRYLANVEGFYTTLEDKIAAVQILFDAYSAPPETLDWLASWFGIVLDPAWDEQRRRLFIKHAMIFFQYRGTIRGLQMALRLALDTCPAESIFSDTPSRTSLKNHIRIVEKYRTRKTPGVVFGDPTGTTGIEQSSASLPVRWLPPQRRQVLNQRYVDFLTAQGQQVTNYPLAPPAEQAVNAAWTDFSLAVLGFVPAITQADPKLWQDFLVRRYQSIGALNSAYGANLTSFAGIELPGQLPQDGPSLLDWYQFESVVLAMHLAAHRFTVLLPVASTETANLASYQQQLELATRLIELEKPAHTVFDVKFYWAAFRVGEARLGEDTLLDRGSRAPQLMPPVIVGQGYLSQGYLAPGFPQDATDRQIIGQERLSR